MYYEQFEEIMSKYVEISWEGCNVFLGLEIIRKYLPGAGITAAGHDIIYSVSIDDIIEAGITDGDAIRLRQLNWMTDEEGLACYV